MLATRAPPRDRPAQADRPPATPVNVQWGWAPPDTLRIAPPDAAAGDPDSSGISLCERERRWACEWWPPD
jgi:hypothetical protein